LVYHIQAALELKKLSHHTYRNRTATNTVDWCVDAAAAVRGGKDVNYAYADALLVKHICYR